MKRHLVAAIVLAAGLALPALAAEKSTVVGAAAAKPEDSVKKESKKTAAKKKPATDKKEKVAQVDKSKAREKNQYTTTPRMRGYGD